MWKIQLLLYSQARKLDSHPKAPQCERLNKRGKVTISKNLGVWLLPPEADWKQIVQELIKFWRNCNSKQTANLAFKNLWLIIGIIFVAPILHQQEVSCESSVKASKARPVTEKTQGTPSQRTKKGALRDRRQGIYLRVEPGAARGLIEVLLHYLAGNHHNSCLEGFGNCYGPMITIYFSFLSKESLSCLYSTTVYLIHGKRRNDEG